MRIDLSSFTLGMPRDGQVTLLEHQAKWAVAFTHVSKDMKAFVKPLEIDLHHIGSTSIPYIKAKPILDILGVVDGFEHLDQLQAPLERYGLVWKGEYGVLGRRFCVQYDSAEQNSYLHLHVFEKDHVDVSRLLLFRDYLRAFPAAALAYQNEKDRLKQQHSNDRKLYSAGKTEFIERILNEALSK